MANKPSRRHHIVPRFYLEAFTNDEGHVRVHDKHTGREYETSPINVAVEKDFYELDLEGFEPDAAEKWISTIESDAADAIRRMLTHVFPTSLRDRRALSRFVALQAARGRSFRGFTNDRFAALSKDTLRMMAETASEAELREVTTIGEGEDEQECLKEARQELRDAEFEVTLVPSTQIALSAALVRVAAESIAARHWLLVRMDDVITGDEPLVVVSDTEKKGLATADELRLPLSPSHILAMLHPAHAHHFRTTGEEEIHLESEDSLEWQRASFKRAQRYVYRHPSTPLLDVEVDRDGRRSSGDLE